MPNGNDAQEVLVGIRNTGTVPIGVVHADITPFRKGEKLGSGASDYTIFYECGANRGIQPGQTHDEWPGDGFVLIPIPGLPPFADSVAVRIRRVQPVPEC